MYILYTNIIQYIMSLFCKETIMQWNLYNETREVLLKTHKFCHLSGTVFIKSCLSSLSWKTTCLERPQNSVVALYRFHCNRTQHSDCIHLSVHQGQLPHPMHRNPQLVNSVSIESAKPNISVLPSDSSDGANASRFLSPFEKIWFAFVSNQTCQTNNQPFKRLTKGELEQTWHLTFDKVAYAFHHIWQKVNMEATGILSTLSCRDVKKQSSNI